jgi:sugar transferase (PEP-CTERM/EpsH1 system associated)
MLWSDLPNPYTGACIPAFNLMKYLSQIHEITLLTFQATTKENRYKEDVSKFCASIEVLPLEEPKSMLKLFLFVAMNTLSPQNLLSKNPVLLEYYYSPQMQKKVRNLLATRKFDLIYTDMRMAHYVQEVTLPKVVHELDCMTEMYRQWYDNAQNLAMKLFQGIQYLKIRNYEIKMLQIFDACICLSEYDGRQLKSLCPDIHLVVVPLGVDAEFFKPTSDQEEPLALLFVGDMRHPPNQEAVLYFHSQIYAKVRKDHPGIRLYIVGRNPSNEIQKLALDKSIIVTGYVDDVRPYLARASVVIAPFLSGTGMKIKILEALAMDKPVVSTSVGARGIDVTPNENIILADNPEEFAARVVELLRNETLRRRIACNGRKLVETSYSWKSAADKLNEIFEVCNT